MRHSLIKPLICLSLFSLGAAACADDSDDNSNSSSQEQSGSGGRTSSAGGRAGSSVSSAGRGGTTTLAGRGGSTASAGTNGSSVSAGRGGNGAGRGGSGGAAANGGRGGSTTGTGGAAGQTAAAIGDAEISAILTAANNGEVQQNNVAVTKAVAPAARSFAQDLVNMHTAAQTRLNGVISAENLTPKDSTVSADLTKASSQIVSKLQAADLNGFDMAYLQSQIDVHRQVLELIDQRLLPSVKSTALRAELTATRAAVVEHLNRARAIATTLDLSVDAGSEADAGF